MRKTHMLRDIVRASMVCGLEGRFRPIIFTETKKLVTCKFCLQKLKGK